MTELKPSPLASGDELPVARAQALIAQALAALPATPPSAETVPLTEALGRVLLADLLSPIDVPAHDNSAMDGFAFDGAALAAGVELSLALQETIHAGDARPLTIAPGACARIMTGAVMPAGCDTVVPVELARLEGDRVQVRAGVIQRGENRRKRGEDLARGGVALPAGQKLRPADLGLAASLGLAQLRLRPRQRVALFSTGNEVVEPGQPLPPGCIYDSNRASLRGALQRLGAEVLDLGIVRDEPAALATALEQAVAQADAIVTSGGVSMGDADYTRDVLARLGEVGFWKVAMRPGRPFAFGPVSHAGRTALLFALPGNPVAALVTFHVFVAEALARLAGARERPALTVRAKAQMAVRKRPGRSEYQRGMLSRDEQGDWQVRLTGSQGAGVLSSMSQADGLIVLGHEQGSVAAGDWVEVMPLGDTGA